MTRSRHGPRAPRAPQVRDRFASPDGRLPGVGPFDAVVVTAVHKDGAVDVALEVDPSRTFTHVNPRHLTSID